MQYTSNFPISLSIEFSSSDLLAKCQSYFCNKSHSHRCFSPDMCLDLENAVEKVHIQQFLINQPRFKLNPQFQSVSTVQAHEAPALRTALKVNGNHGKEYPKNIIPCLTWRQPMQTVTFTAKRRPKM